MRDLMVGTDGKEVTNGEGHGSLRGVRLARSPIEFLPKWLLCVPLVAHWVWLALVYRSATLPSALNPTIETGGLAGESKLSYLEGIDVRFGQWVAETFLVRPGDDPIAVRKRAGLSFPLIAKPDIGWCGYGVRRVDSDRELEAYALAFPRDAAFLLQRFVAERNEAGLLYVRDAGAAHGGVTAVTVRHGPHVEGDGVRSIACLIACDARTRDNYALYFNKFGAGGMTRVPAMGERVELTTVASLRVGGRYEDLSHLITPELSTAVDAIALSIGAFHYGRFDVKFESLHQLLGGRFTIIEINGAGSEAIQFWDPKLSLVEAFSGVFAKQRALFALADKMRKRGHKPVGLYRLATAYIRQQRLVGRYPASN